MRRPRDQEDIHILAVGDTLSPIGFALSHPATPPIPVDLAGKTLKVFGKKDDGSAWIAEADATAHPTRAFTVDTTDDWIIDNDNLAANGDQIVVSNSGGGLPSGLTAATRYFVRDRQPNRFRVSLSPGGDIVDITSAGTGTQSYYIVGSGQYDFADDDVAEAGTFWLWVRVYDGSEFDTFPILRKANDRGLRVDIVEAA